MSAAKAAPAEAPFEIEWWDLDSIKPYPGNPAEDLAEGDR